MANDTIVCRCEDITQDEIRALIAKGVTDIEQMKRLLRVGMGPCQGRTCTPLLIRELAKAKGISVAEMKLITVRPPTIPVKFATLLRGENHDEKCRGYCNWRRSGRSGDGL